MIINKKWVNPFEPSDVMNYGEIDFGDAAKVTIQKSFYDNTDLLDLSGKDIELTNNGQLYTNGTLKAFLSILVQHYGMDVLSIAMETCT